MAVAFSTPLILKNIVTKVKPLYYTEKFINNHGYTQEYKNPYQVSEISILNQHQRAINRDYMRRNEELRLMFGNKTIKPKGNK